MKRVWAAAAIFVVLVALCISGIALTVHMTDNTEDYLEQAQQAAENKDKDKASNLIDTITEKWRGYHKIMSTYIPHARLEAIDQTLALLGPSIKNEDYDSFLAECNRAESMINHLKDTEMPTADNVL